MILSDKLAILYIASQFTIAGISVYFLLAQLDYNMCFQNAKTNHTNIMTCVDNYSVYNFINTFTTLLLFFNSLIIAFIFLQVKIIKCKRERQTFLLRSSSMM